MGTPHRAALAGVSSLVLASLAVSYPTGVFPGVTGALGPVPATVHQVAGCGACHFDNTPGANALELDVAPDKLVLEVNEQISITSSATGGQAHAMDWGGFLTHASAGAFTAGSNSQTDGTGAFVTHLDASMSNGRSWTYGFTAPAAPGPIELCALVNTVNGNSLAIGDIWRFWGFDPAALFCTPIRMYANAPGVQAIGQSCEGGFGNTPVLGSPESPTAGNQNFSLEVVGAVDGGLALFLIGVPQASVPLDGIGVTGCTLDVAPFLVDQRSTGPGIPLRGDGRASYALPIPSTLPAGAVFGAQVAVVDLGAPRATPITMTNGLAITVR